MWRVKMEELGLRASEVVQSLRDPAFMMSHLVFPLRKHFPWGCASHSGLQVESDLSDSSGGKGN